MYAYIPDDLLLQGIKLKEFKYSDCEENVREKEEIIEKEVINKNEWR